MSEAAHDEQEWIATFEQYRSRAEELLDGPVKLLDAAPVLYQGWELDSWVWLVEAGGADHLLSTNHGSLCVFDHDRATSAIALYEDAAARTRALLDRQQGSARR